MSQTVERAKQWLRDYYSRPVLDRFTDELAENATGQELESVLRLRSVGKRILERSPLKRGPQRRVTEARIESDAIYSTEELEARLGRTLWRAVKQRIRPLVRGRYAGRAILQALECIESEPGSLRIVNIAPAGKPKRGGKGKANGRVQGSDPMRVRLNHKAS